MFSKLPEVFSLRKMIRSGKWKAFQPPTEPHEIFSKGRKINFSFRRVEEIKNPPTEPHIIFEKN
jgi:hypothetical protein